MQRISEIEREYVLAVLNSQFRSSAGTTMTKRLEQKFAEVFQSKYAIAFINGTSTMHASLAAAGIGPGDEVIVPPLTFVSTAFAVVHANATPVFADIDPYTWTIDPESIEDRITSRTKAIIPVAIYGLSPDMDAIMNIAQKYGLFVLEDDAECFLGYYKGKIVGNIGHAASFSFENSKHVTSGQGGMVITNDEELAKRIRRFSHLGYASVSAEAGEGKVTKAIIQDPEYQRHVSLGWNYIMPELCAAVSLAQVERIYELVNTRIRAAQLYQEVQAGCDWLTPQKVLDGYIHSYWTYVLKLENEDVPWRRFRQKYMELGGDGIYAAWLPTHLEPVFRNVKVTPSQQQIFEPGLCPVAESIQPYLLQFKTNYFDLSDIERQATALSQTIAYFQ